jgi:hypothetical protein
MARVFVGNHDDTVRKDLDWPATASAMIKSQLKWRDWTYADLAKALAEFGVEESEASIRNKLSRGTFPATFLIQCLGAMNMAYISLTPIYEDRPAEKMIVMKEPDRPDLDDPSAD